MSFLQKMAFLKFIIFISMKNLFFYLILLLPFYLTAQTRSEWKRHRYLKKYSLDEKKIVLSMDTVFKVGEPYCILISHNQSWNWEGDFEVKTMSGVKLIHIYKQQENTGDVRVSNQSISSVMDNFYRFDFVQLNEKYEISSQYGESVEELVANMNLIQGDSIPRSAILKMLETRQRKKSGGGGISILGENINLKIPSKANNETPSPSGQALILRNREASFDIYGEEIVQDFKTVGKIKKETDEKGNFFMIYLPDGARVAKAQTDSNTPNLWRLFTFVDNQQFTIPIQNKEETKAIIELLIAKKYL